MSQANDFELDLENRGEPRKYLQVEKDETGWCLQRLFSPQHGFRNQLGQK